MTNTNTNIDMSYINMVEDLHVAAPVTDKPVTAAVADSIGEAAEYVVNCVEDTVISTYVNVVSGFDRTIKLVDRLIDETPRIRKAAQDKAQARLDARFGKRVA